MDFKMLTLIISKVGFFIPTSDLKWYYMSSMKEVKWSYAHALPIQVQDYCTTLKPLSSALLWKELKLKPKSDSFWAVCFTVGSMVVLSSSHWWLCIVMCCSRVWLLGRALDSVSLPSITIAYTQTQRCKKTRIVAVYELGRYGACIIWATHKTVICSFLFCEGVTAFHYCDERLGSQPGV